MHKKITIDEVNRIMKTMGVSYGTNVIFPEKIDTSLCRDFFGKRCPHNIHVIGEGLAHRDRADPRSDWRRHLDEDVGIPHEILPIGVGSGVGAVIGALIGGKRGAGIGAIFGALVGVFFEIITESD